MTGVARKELWMQLTARRKHGAAGLASVSTSSHAFRLVQEGGQLIGGVTLESELISAEMSSLLFLP